MRITRMYYGDYHVVDNFPFNVISLESASDRIFYEDGVRVHGWPVTIDLNQKTGYWEVWFTRPASDEEYVQNVPEVPGDI